MSMSAEGTCVAVVENVHVEMQPEASLDLTADLRELGAGPVPGRGMAEFEEAVTLEESRAILR